MRVDLERCHAESWAAEGAGKVAREQHQELLAQVRGSQKMAKSSFAATARREGPRLEHHIPPSSGAAPFSDTWICPRGQVRMFQKKQARGLSRAPRCYSRESQRWPVFAVLVQTVV